MTALPEVLGPSELSNGFLGNLIQVCVVTRDHQRTLEGFVGLGIGPWSIRTVDGSNMRATYRGAPADFALRLCLANSQNMNWEVIEPLSGRSIYADFLERHGEGVQHLAFGCNGMEYADRVREFGARGYRSIQHGELFGGIAFHYFAGRRRPEDHDRGLPCAPRPPLPPPDAWYPAPPP